MDASDLNHLHRVGNVVPAGSAIPRRRFLELLAVAGATAVVSPGLAALGGRADAGPLGASASPTSLTFPDGVMAGDPRPLGSVLWTRVTPPVGGGDATIGWEVATDDSFSTIVAGGSVDALAAAGYTAKVAVDGLDPDSWYHYRFSLDGVASTPGRLRTAPAPDSTPERLTFAWASCQQTSSPYTAHRLIAAEPDLDFWMHLGDYVYVSDQGTQSVPDYRDVYARFKGDANLQALQAAVPTVAMYDDGEFVNGVHRDIEPEGRLENALQVWFEQFPVIPPDGDDTRAYRSLSWGDLAETFLLDVRQYRDAEVPEGSGNATLTDRERFNPDRTTLGTEQRSWLLDGLADAAAVWKLLGNPYNFAPWRILGGADQPIGGQRFTTNYRDLANVHVNQATYAPNEAWDDFWFERRTILDHLADEDVTNLISVSGHTHIWLADVLRPDYDDPDAPVVGFDFTCGSLTADPDFADANFGGIGGRGDPDVAYPLLSTVAGLMEEWNPWKAYTNFINQGYGLVTLTPARAVVEFKAVNTYDADATAEVLARFTIEAGERRMRVELWPTPCYTCSPTTKLVPVVPSRMFPSALPRAEFSDVAPSASYATAVDWLAANGITTGVAPGRFGPGEVVTRRQMALFMHRLMGSPAPVGTSRRFDDVRPTGEVARAVAWLDTANVTQIAPGTDGRLLFRPDEPVTRAQMAAFLWRLAGELDGSPVASFSDVTRDRYYSEAVDWMAFYGITTGIGGTTRYAPRDPVTRWQMALFLWRLASQPAAWNPSVPLPASVRSARD
jgi:alkaline phosphatase D